MLYVVDNSDFTIVAAVDGKGATGVASAVVMAEGLIKSSDYTIVAASDFFELFSSDELVEMVRNTFGVVNVTTATALTFIENRLNDLKPTGDAEINKKLKIHSYTKSDFKMGAKLIRKHLKRRLSSPDVKKDPEEMRAKVCLDVGCFTGWTILKTYAIYDKWLSERTSK